MIFFFNNEKFQKDFTLVSVNINQAKLLVVEKYSYRNDLPFFSPSDSSKGGKQLQGQLKPNGDMGREAKQTILLVGATTCCNYRAEIQHV